MKPALHLITALVLTAGLLAAPAFARDQAVTVAPATHPSLTNADLPPLIPLDTFFSTRTESWDHRVSPDGRRMLWIALHDDKPSVHIRDLDEDEVHVIAGARAVKWAYWAADSRHVTGWWDDNGDENYHFLLADTGAENPEFRDVTPYDGVKIAWQQWFPDKPLQYLLRDNGRDPGSFDLYRYDFATGERTLIMENPGDISRFYTDSAGEVYAISRTLPNGDKTIEVPDGDNWREVMRGTAEDVFWISGHPPPGQDWAWGVSNIGRDKQAIVRVEIKTGVEEVIYQDPDADVTQLMIDEITYELMMAVSAPDYNREKVFDPALQPIVDLAARDGPFSLGFRSWDRAKQVFTLRLSRDVTGDQYFLYDRRTEEMTPLASPRIADRSDGLSKVTPIKFQARDGMTINGYLTIPAGTDGENLPMVLAVHGGPFWRDTWGYHDYDQLFANRGYAVLRVNYRGSTGFGRAYVAAAAKEFAGAMHDDLIDGVNWAIAQGVADPDKVAIYGRSYGGYATLVGLTFTPDVFAAGVNVVGVSDLVTAMETFPPYWRNWLGRWHKYLGRLDNPADVAHMRERSPITYVDRITKPLLVVHGANDVRVVREHSDRIVATARAKGVDVDYIVFEDEGHRIEKWENRMTLARAIETFLARHLGGRAQIGD